MGNDHQIKINLKADHKNNFSFSLNFNNETTFNEALDIISYNLPQYNICPCFEFQYFNKSKWIKIDKNSKIKELNISEVTINHQKCKCNKIFKKYFKKSKIEIINDLDKIIDDSYKQNTTIKNKENEIKKLYSQIERLKKEKQIIEMSINGDISKIKSLVDLGIKGEYLTPKENIIKIDPNTNQIIGDKVKNQKINFIDFYDVIINIKSIKDITKGWEIKMSKRAEDNYEKFKRDEVIKIGVIGNANKGKSFLLSKISKINLPSGTSIRTEGLSIKYPEINNIYKNRTIVLLDSAGLETPVLKEENEKIDNLKDFFKEKSREKLITELFLQNYIIYNSDILIIVVGILTYSEQKLLNKIKSELQRAKINKTLYIIHNLKTFTTINQVEEYINSFLLKNATFTLKEKIITSTKSTILSGRYFYEINAETKDTQHENNKHKNNKNKNNEPTIFHLIFANEDSKAGKFYNELTLDFIENLYQHVINIKPFDVIQTIKQRFIDISKEIIEKTDKDLTIENFDEENKNLIKFNITNGEITLKRCLIDELGFSNLKANGFEPTYNYYKKDNKIIVRVEAPGNTSIIPKIDYVGEFTILRLNGIKKKDKEPDKLEDNIFNNREFGKYTIEIYLDTNLYIIKNKEPEIKELKGVLMLEYTLQDKIEGGGYQPKDEI